MDWSDAYANSTHIEGSDAYPPRWAAEATAYRETADGEWGISYGDDPLQRFDLIHPSGMAKGLAVFVHGGYWMQTDRDLWTWAAQGAVAAGWAVALPGYVKAPRARVGEIPRAVAKAVALAADRIPGPIRLAGHSAGGHIVTRMLCADPMDRIEHVLSISGLHDLRPLMWTDMNQTLNLNEAEAKGESPALLHPANRPVTAWVGGAERPVFIDQARALAAMWGGLGLPMRLEIAEGHHHFSVIDGLAQPDSPITQTFIGDLP